MRKYYYQVYPVNYTLLHEDEQISIVEGFKELLNQIRRDIVIMCRRETREIRWEDRVFEADIYSFYVESMERLDELLEASGLLYQPLFNPSPTLLDPARVIVKPRYIIHEGRIYRVLLPTDCWQHLQMDSCRRCLYWLIRGDPAKPLHRHQNAKIIYFIPTVVYQRS